MAPVYAVVEARIKDPQRFREYVAGHLPTIARHGGRIVARSVGNEAIEGGWAPEVLVIQEWPSAEAFHAWYESADYRPWREVRGEACDLRIALMTAGSAPALARTRP